MKYLLLILLVGCKGQDVVFVEGPSGKDGEQCSVDQTYYGARVSCPDGSYQDIYDGQDGSDGSNGSPGADGHSLVVVQSSATSCVNGGVVITTAVDMDNSGSISAGDANVQSATVCNGSNGAPGTTSPFSVTTILDPCGDSPGVYDEVLLKLQNGTLLASFSDNVNGLNTRFSVIPAGSYKTTDGSNCFFSVDSSGNLFNEHF